MWHAASPTHYVVQKHPTFPCVTTYPIINLFNLENSVGRGCRVQDIDLDNVAGKIVVTLLVIRLFPA